MKNIKVNLSQNGYEIKIGAGLLDSVAEELIYLGFKSKVIIITNPKVYRLWGERLQNSLAASGLKIFVLEVPDGEGFKSLEQAGKIYEQLSEIQAERMTPIVALGGGVIGDLAGFVAATYLRGVPFIQIPTTLLAQVDSSVGGKVAVNHGRLKNIIGNFYQPKVVIADISTLKTLPESEYINGMAEVIKHGVILDKDLFVDIENEWEKIKTKDEIFLENIISRSIEIKSGIVLQDEKDTGLRNILNYGHTVGHAIETVSDFKIKHGNGVAIGMVAAGRISNNSGILSRYDMERVETLLRRSGLPANITGLDIGRILDAMQYDKKKVGGKIKFVLLKTIGEVFITDEVNSLQVEQVLRDLYEETQDLRNNR